MSTILDIRSGTNQSLAKVTVPTGGSSTLTLPSPSTSLTISLSSSSSNSPSGNASTIAKGSFQSAPVNHKVAFLLILLAMCIAIGVYIWLAPDSPINPTRTR